MRIAIIGASGLGFLLGGLLARVGRDVTLIDFAPELPEVVSAIEAEGLRLVDRSGAARAIPLRATSDPAAVGTVDLLIVCVRYYQTDAALRAARPMLGAETIVLSLQPGWGDAPRIAAIVGAERTLVGLTEQRAAVLGPNTVRHARAGRTLIGSLAVGSDGPLASVTGALNEAGIAATPTAEIVREVWRNLAIEACTLPLCALLHCPAGDLVEHAGSLDLMAALLGEVVAVAGAQGLALDYAERWRTLNALLEGALAGRSDILQELREDIEHGRRSDIDATTGAVVADGKRLSIPTPHHETLLWLVRSLETRDDGI